MRRAAKVGALAGIAGLTAMQFVPVERTNPLGSGDVVAPRAVERVLRRSCFDCHSGETRWPVWAYVAPVSWQVVRDVDRARAALNFSDWDAYPEPAQVGYKVMVAAVTEAHRMPLWYYLPLHPDARLSDEDRAMLATWAREGLAAQAN